MLVELLNQQSGVEVSRINRIAKTASKRYKIYEIPKKKGGFRTIEHPSRELKAIQRWISNYVFKDFPIHNCATAYKKGTSIKKNAELHQNTLFTIRVDFKNFFPSFSSYGIREFLKLKEKQLKMKLSNADIEFICDIVCRNGHLTIGAPTSPIISNIMMYDFDGLVSEYSTDKNLVYSRYADDIFISAAHKNSLNEIEAKVEEIITEVPYLNLQVNLEKTAFLSRRYRRSIAGLIITPEFKVSIGRERKREIKTLIFKYKNQQLTQEKIEYLRGLLSFASDMEPEFLRRLTDKHKEKVINSILKGKG